MAYPQRILFVGERRSQTAIKMGVTWFDGRLCAMTLHEALAQLGIDAKDPERVGFVNLWRDEPMDLSLDEHPRLEYVINGDTFEHIRRTASLSNGWTIVGLGKKVQRVLDQEGIPHLKMIHPAARGAIRGKYRYWLHVARALGGDPADPDSMLTWR